jgi:hypothetical protein
MIWLVPFILKMADAGITLYALKLPPFMDAEGIMHSIRETNPLMVFLYDIHPTLLIAANVLGVLFSSWMMKVSYTQVQKRGWKVKAAVYLGFLVCYGALIQPVIHNVLEIQSFMEEMP